MRRSAMLLFLLLASLPVFGQVEPKPAVKSDVSPGIATKISDDVKANANLLKFTNDIFTEISKSVTSGNLVPECNMVLGAETELGLTGKLAGKPKNGVLFRISVLNANGYAIAEKSFFIGIPLDIFTRDEQQAQFTTNIQRLKSLMTCKTP